MKKNIFKRVSLSAVLAISSMSVMAQDVHFTQFNSTPLLLNPAFTGAFNGPVRASAIYRNQWNHIYKTFAASVDAPIVREISGDDYLAGGVQLYNDVSGDASLANFSGLLSLAYHKFLGTQGNKILTVGLQGGYTSKSLDISKLYYGNQFDNGTYTGPSNVNVSTAPIRYFTANLGIAYSQRVSDNVSFIIGAAGNNLNQPKESINKIKNSDVGLGRRINAQAGAIIFTGERFNIRPAVLYQMQSATKEMIAGSEFGYIIGNDPEVRALAPSIYVGGWYRNNDAAMFSAGLEYQGFRFGVGYDVTLSNYNTVNKAGAIEFSLRYIGLNPIDAARSVVYPCARF